MDITISLTDGVAIYRQILNQIKDLAGSGVLRLNFSAGDIVRMVQERRVEK